MQIINNLWYFLKLILSSIPENRNCFKECNYFKYTNDLLCCFWKWVN